jgi:hypothetical protein
MVKHSTYRITSEQELTAVTISDRYCIEVYNYERMLECVPRSVAQYCYDKLADLIPIQYAEDIPLPTTENATSIKLPILDICKPQFGKSIGLVKARMECDGNIVSVVLEDKPEDWGKYIYSCANAQKLQHPDKHQIIEILKTFNASANEQTYYAVMQETG